MEIQSFAITEVLRFAIILMRVAGIVVFAPLFTSRIVPIQFKILFSLVISLALLPAVPLAGLPAEPGLPFLMSCAFSQFLVGMTLGLVASFVFAGLQLAGQLISFQLGFAIIKVIDPQSDVESSLFSFIENYLGLLFFLLINGHHWYFMAVSDSFNYLPVQGILLQGPIVQEVIRLSSQILVIGVQVAGPIVAVTITCDVVLGIIGRATPQIHILIVGMPLKTLVGFTCLTISFYFMPRFLGEAFMKLYRDLFALLHALV